MEQRDREGGSVRVGGVGVGYCRRLREREMRGRGKRFAALLPSVGVGGRRGPRKAHQAKRTEEEKKLQRTREHRHPSSAKFTKIKIDPY